MLRHPPPYLARQYDLRMSNAAPGRGRLDSFIPPAEVREDPQKFAAWQRMNRRSALRWALFGVVSAIPFCAVALLAFRWRLIPENVALISLFAAMLVMIPVLFVMRRRDQRERDEFARTVLDQVPGLARSGEQSIDARVSAIEDEYLRLLSRRLKVTMIVVSVALIVLSGIVAFEVADPTLAVWVVVLAAVVGVGIVALVVWRHLRERTAAIARVRGENPLF